MQRFSKFDADGKKLFQPELLATPRRSDQSNVTAEEFLYRDALDREERMRRRARAAKSSDKSVVNAKKINMTSEALLKRKAVRPFVIDHYHSSYVCHRRGK